MNHLQELQALTSIENHDGFIIVKLPNNNKIFTTENNIDSDFIEYVKGLLKH